MSNLIKHRTDIDGLRALAVIPVILFHAGYDWVSGGFVGVDVFFVISGFLISSILVKEMNAGYFTFAQFYERRVRRIVPALLTVLIASLIGGYFILLPGEYSNLGKTTVTTLTFVPNIHYWITSSTYFGIDIVTLPLLHTWSLGVEEQFYLLFPPLLVVLRKLPKASLVPITLLLIFSLSLWVNLGLAERDSRFSFYMLPTRAWELLAGVIVSLGLLPTLRQRLLANVLSFTGLVLILVPMAVLNEHSVFPGINAVFPALGAALLIYSNTEVKTTVRSLLEQPILVYVGLISYSLYLWHWPIVVYTRMFWDSPDNKPFIVALSMVCASLSYRFVESRYRKRSSKQHRLGRLYELVGGTALLLLVSVSLIISGGLPWRVPKTVRAVIDHPDNRVAGGSCEVFSDDDPEHKASLCRLGASGAEPRFLVWGDSHAHAISHALHLAANERGVPGVVISNGGCQPLLGVYRKGERRCQVFNEKVRGYLEAHPTINQVYLVGYWRVPVRSEGYDNNNFLIMDDLSQSTSRQENRRVFVRGLQRTLDLLVDRQVFLVQDIPEIGSQFGKSVVSLLARQIWTGQANLAQHYFDNSTDSFDQEFRELLGHVSKPPAYIEINTRLCQGQRCPLLSGDKLIYSDGDHLSKHGASLLAPVFRPYLSRIASTTQ